jgi:hypothetical protein
MVKGSITRTVGKVLLATMLTACATGTDVKQTGGSGFLRDYSNLVETRAAQGGTFRGWVSPKLTPATYDAVMLDPLVFYPEPRPSEHVSTETLQQLLAYSNDAFRRSVSERFRVVDRAAPGVLRLRVAFTGLAAQGEGLKPYQYVPIAFVATMAARAATGTPQRAFIVVETEGTDSLTGELLGLRMRVGTGERLVRVGAQQVITLDTVKPLLDELVAGSLPELEKYVRPK